MPGHRTTCYYCKQSVLSRDIGLHIIKSHEADLFKEKINLKILHRDKYLTQPLLLSLGDEAFHFCFADNSCIRHSINADNHFKGKTDKHREAVLALREKYPQDGSVPVGEVVVRREYLSDTETKLLQDIFAQIVVADTIGFSKKDKALLLKLGISVEPDKIKEMYPQLYPDEEEEEQEEIEEEQQPPPETPAPEESFEFHEHKVVAQPKIQERPVTALPKTNYALAKPSPPAAPQLKIISNTKSKT